MKLVGIHGIGQTYIGPEEIKTSWLAAIQDGLREAGEPPIAAVDFGMVGYGAIFRPQGQRLMQDPIVDPETLLEWEKDLIQEWTKQVITGEGAISSEKTRRLPASIQGALRLLSGTKFFEALGGERAILFAVRQVRLFLLDPEIKALVLKRVKAQISPQTRVVVAHSLGSVVAYEALCLNTDWNVNTLLTFGSPLGINLVFNRLTPAPVYGKAAFPRVQNWINIADSGDIVALQGKLADKFGNVRDVNVYNGWHSHHSMRYLNTREAGLAIAAGLKSTTP